MKRNESVTPVDVGVVIVGDAFEQDPSRGQFPLIICDPPYGGITKEDWDVSSSYDQWFLHCADHATPDATIVMWGGVGKYRNRPFLRFAASVEDHAGWQIKNWITWAKKRAYGVSDNYLFTREECLILTRGKPTFNIPLLEVKRGYAGYNAKYPAKSEYLRRTNVWTDITEIFKGKVHPTQKPDALYEVLIATHSSPGDVVYDPCAGSGVTVRAARKLGRNFCVVEKEEKYLEAGGILVRQNLEGKK